MCVASYYEETTSHDQMNSKTFHNDENSFATNIYKMKIIKVFSLSCHFNGKLKCLQGLKVFMFSCY